MDWSWLVAGIGAGVILILTLRAVLRDGHRRRPTRDLYDTRKPEP